MSRSGNVTVVSVTRTETRAAGIAPLAASASGDKVALIEVDDVGVRGPSGTAGPEGPAGVTFISDAPPFNPTHGREWWQSNTGNHFIYYVDPSGPPGQWVQVNVGSGGGSVGSGHRVEFTADGSGVGTGTDATAAIQLAIDTAASEGGFVVVPFTGTGIYLVNGTIQMKSNVTVRCEPGVKLDGRGANATHLSFLGAVGTEINTTANLTRGDTAIACASPHGGAVGDFFQIIGQRNALAYIDAGPWCCGNGTSSLNYAYFAEWLPVAEVGSTTQFTSAKPLFFPNYRIDATLETDSLRTHTTVRKMSAIVDAHWIGGEWLFANGTATLMTGRYAVDCTVEDCIVRRGKVTGVTLYWDVCYRCEGRRIRNFNDPDLVWDYATMHSFFNRFKIISSQDCGFVECEDEYGGQSIDLSYGLTNPPLLNVRPRIVGCEFRRLYEGVTSHPGNYGEEWRDNRFLDCWRNAIILRGLAPIVSGNVATSATELLADIGDGSADFSVAFDFYNGHTRDLHAFGNDVTGFRYAFRVRDGSGPEACFGVVNGVIESNAISECYGGLTTAFSATNISAERRGLVYRDNIHTRMHRYVINLEGYSCGCQIAGNTLHGDFLLGDAATSAYFVLAVQNCPALVITGNKWYRTSGGNSGKTIRMVSIGSIGDAVTYPSVTFAFRTVVRDNIIDAPLNTRYTYNQTSYVQTDAYCDGDDGVVNGMLSTSYTPAVTPVANVDSATPSLCYYTIAGNWVHVLGSVSIDCTANAVSTQLRVSLPVPSAFTTVDDAAGVAAASAINSTGRIFADATNDAAVIGFISASTGAVTYGFNFAYRIR